MAMLGSRCTGNGGVPPMWGRAMAAWVGRRKEEGHGDVTARVKVTPKVISRRICTTPANMSTKQLTLENMNPHVKKMEYAVRGAIVIRAAEIEEELAKGVPKPFKETTRANLGDCHAVGQQPITFNRQVLSCCLYPQLLAEDIFPSDVKERAKRVLSGCRGSSMGAYTDSVGIDVIRKDVAKFIEDRDGYPSNPADITLCGGASDGIRNVLKLFNHHINGQQPGIMIPIPQYPLYTGTVVEYGMKDIFYYLDEDNNWGLNIAELKRSVNEARKTSNPRAIVVINPGNPTGQVLSKQNIQEIIKFAHEEKLFIMADEVYQFNIYAEGSEFHSFKKVMMEMGAPYNQLELASFMSASKGYMGECGIRGGFVELINIDPDVRAMYQKSISVKLCSTTVGQAMIECIVNPPKKGEPSYNEFIDEKNGVLGELKKRAKMVETTFNSIPGMKCNVVQGAMYAFPKITIPQKAIDAAKVRNIEPDMLLALELLDATGIVVVPGSGFFQIPGTYHFRTTILPPTEKLAEMVEKYRVFYADFLKRYS